MDGVNKMTDNQNFTLKQKILAFLVILCFICNATFLCLHLLIAALISLAGIMIFYGWLLQTEINVSIYLNEQLDHLQEETKNSGSSHKNTRRSSANDKLKTQKILELENELKTKTELLSSVSEKYEALLNSQSDNVNSSEVLDESFMASLLPPITGEQSEMVDIIRITQDTIEELRSFAIKSGIDIRLTNEKSEIFVKANRERLHIMFRNIIDNSIKYMGKRGFLQITVSNIDDDIFIILKDNGYGLSSDETSHIFELNYQGSNRISGNGLGLTQAKAIVNYYGGTIYARSTKGNGMGIYIQLPTNEVTGGGE